MDRIVQEVPLGTTTFSGPIRAGTIKDTSGKTLGVDVANVGFATMVQTGEVFQRTGPDMPTNVYATDIVLPAHSRVLMVTGNTIVQGTGASVEAAVGWDPANPNQLGDGMELFSNTSGYSILVPDNVGLDAGANWVDVGDKDRRIYVKCANQGAGRSVINIQYIQG